MQEKNVGIPNIFNGFLALTLGFHSAVFRESRMKVVLVNCDIEMLRQQEVKGGNRCVGFTEAGLWLKKEKWVKNLTVRVA